MITIVSSLLRHLLTTVGGGLVAKGVLTSTTLDEGIGAAITLIGIVWSVLEKRSGSKSNTQLISEVLKK
jgi:hypothetical protein